MYLPDLRRTYFCHLDGISVKSESGKRGSSGDTDAVLELRRRLRRLGLQDHYLSVQPCVIKNDIFSDVTSCLTLDF